MNSIKKYLSFFFVIFLCVTVITGCGSLFTDNNATKIAIIPGKCEIVIGGEKQLEVVSYNSNGDVLNTKGNWSIDKPEIGEINADGLFKSKAVGTCTVTCSSGQLTAQAVIEVTKIGEAGKQIIKDTQNIFNDFHTIAKLKYNKVFEDLQNDLMPQIAYLQTAMQVTSEHGNNMYFFSGLFRLTPGEYTAEEVNSVERSITKVYTGKWTVDFSDGWKLTVTRSVVGDNDKVEVVQNSTNDGKLNYSTKTTYPTRFIVDAETGTNVEQSMSIIIKDSNIKVANLEGTLKAEFCAGGPIDTIGVLSGNGKLEYGDDKYVSFKGEMGVSGVKDGQGYFKGEIENNDLLITGNININYLENENGINGWFPKTAVFDAKISTKEQDPLILEGKLAIEVANAATINTNTDYCEKNWFDATLKFSGLMQAKAGHFMKADLVAEELRYGQYLATLLYQFNNGGVNRSLKFELKNLSDTELQLVIDSSYGEAKITLNADFEDKFYNSSYKNVSGNITVAGKEVATINKEINGLRIAYKDGSFETF